MLSKGLAQYVGPELREKIDNPIEFGEFSGGPGKGYKATILIDVCKAILDAERYGKLASNQKKLAIQAAIIINASAKFGIDNLIDRLTGFNDTREKYIEAFKIYIRDEALEYQKQFSREFYEICYQVYGLD
jgi:hypothetical protein